MLPTLKMFAIAEACISALVWCFMVVVMGKTDGPGVTPLPAIAEQPGAPHVPIPGASEVLDVAGWLSRQQISVWFAIVTILFGFVIYKIIAHLLKGLEKQRETHTAQQQEIQRAHNEELKAIRELNDRQAKEHRESYESSLSAEREHSKTLLEYLQKDHTQTINLMREAQLVIQEAVELFKEVRMRLEREAVKDELLRQGRVEKTIINPNEHKQS